MNCSKCCSNLKETDFYQSQSLLNVGTGRMQICKSCLEGVFHELASQHDGNEMKAMYELCMICDVYFSVELFNKVKESSINGNRKLFSTYFTRVSMLKHSKKRFRDGDSLNILTENVIDIEVEVTEDMRVMWGNNSNYTVEDYSYLNKTYDELVLEFGDPELTQRWGYITIVKAKLETEKALARGDYKMYDKLLDRVQKLLTDSKLKPIQRDQSDEKDTNLIGMWARTIQSEEPIPQAEGIFADADGIMRLYISQFLEPMKRVLGVSK